MKKYKTIAFCLTLVLLMYTSKGAIGKVMIEDSTLRVSELRCQSLRNPIGIDKQNPTFSWKIKSDEKNIAQTAYRIVVASSKDKLDNPDIWDSGIKYSNQNAFIPFEGKSLKTGQKYFWRVKIQDNKKDTSSWSKPASFVTGILSEEEWQVAKWIGYEELQDSLKLFPGFHALEDEEQLGNKAKKRAIIPKFRKDFKVSKKVEKAFVYVSGLGQFQFFLNGEKVNSGFLDPAWSDYSKRDYYKTYDITPLLKKGENTLGAIVGTGFMYVNRERYRKLDIALGYPMLRLKMIIRYSDGTSDELNSNSAWETTTSPITFSSIYGGEDYDARKEHSDWSVPENKRKNNKTKKWKKAKVVSSPGGKMQAQAFPSLAVDSTFKPMEIDSSKSKHWLVDFGRNMSGIIKLKGGAPEGYTLKITPSELVNKDQTPNQEASGEPYYWQYTFKGKETEEWQPTFTYYGFRYAGIELLDQKGKEVNLNKMKNKSFSALHTQKDLANVGSFHSSDTLFNQIFDLIHWGIKNNLSNVSTDAPHREKLGWLEQTHLMGNSIKFNYDIHDFYRKIVGDIKNSQLPNGQIPSIAPEYVEFGGGFRGSPEWGSASILVPWYLYKWYGDSDILEGAYLMMEKYIKYLDKKAENYLLDYGLGDWFDLGPDQPGASQLTPIGVTASSFYFYDNQIMSKIAEVLGKNEDQKKYIEKADTIKKAFNSKYFNNENKVYATGSQTSMAIPLAFGLVRDNDEKKVMENFVDSIIVNDYALTAGDIGYRYVLKALEKGGYDEVIYKMNNRNDVPGYGYQIKKGATALTESWKALKSVSNDHMMLGPLMEWFYTGLAGIEQKENSAGYKDIVISPKFIKEIKGVNASYQSINGLIFVSWARIDNEEIELNVTIPPNTNADVVLPDKTEEIGSGDYTFHFKP